MIIKINNIDNIKIVLIIVTYNSKKFIKKLCSSILLQSYDLSKVLLFIVDNNSNDNTYNEIVKCKESIDDKLNYVFLKLDRNLGFAPANNLALVLASKILRSIDKRIITLLNPDTYILDNNFFKKVEKLGNVLPIVGFATISGDNNEIIDSIGAFVDYLGSPQDILCGVKFTPFIKKFINDFFPSLYYVPLACFAAIAIRGDVIRDIGFLRSYYVMYFEDTEFCLRAWSHNIPVIAYKNFAVWHARGGTQQIRSTKNSSRREDKVFSDISFHFSKNSLLLTYEYLGLFRYILRLVIYGIIGMLFRHQHLAYAIKDSLRIIIRKRIKQKKLPRGLVPRSPRMWTFFWALKYFLRYPDRGLRQAVSYGSKRSSMEYIRYRIRRRIYGDN